MTSAFILSQLPADQVEMITKSATFMSEKDLRWWFAALFILFVLTGLWIVKQLFNYHQRYVDGLNTQLSEQRAANQEQTKQLIAYITGDHIKALEMMQRVGEALSEVGAALVVLNSKLEKQ